MICFTCPTCRKIKEVERREQLPCRPFCCERCQQVDLGKWLTGYYCVSEPLPAGPEDEPQIKAAEEQE